mgnify:CR=1 FL=1
MREHPLLMQGPLVRATLAGLKTQTRRPVKNEALHYTGYWAECRCKEIDPSDTPCVTCAMRFPGIPEAGDRLWVRETFQAWRKVGHESDEWEPIGVKAASFGDTIEYRATSKSTGPWTPSIHMPRWACRLVLPLVSVRVERVQDITEDDAKAEGVERISAGPGWECWMGYGPSSSCKTARDSFRSLWISIYGEASWDANPWVWVAEWDHAEVRK